jgi:hypothetical protein
VREDRYTTRVSWKGHIFRIPKYANTRYHEGILQEMKEKACARSSERSSHELHSSSTDVPSLSGEATGCRLPPTLPAPFTLVEPSELRKLMMEDYPHSIDHSLSVSSPRFTGCPSETLRKLDDEVVLSDWNLGLRTGHWEKRADGRHVWLSDCARKYCEALNMLRR